MKQTNLLNQFTFVVLYLLYSFEFKIFESKIQSVVRLQLSKLNILLNITVHGHQLTFFVRVKPVFDKRIFDRLNDFLFSFLLSSLFQHP